MDTISDFLTRVRNAGAARHEKVDIPSSRSRVGIANVLKEAGFITDFKVVRDGKQGIMRMYLRYNADGSHAISSLDRRSRPGRRYYVPVEKIPSVRSGYGLAILSTNQGIMSGQKAAQSKVGGELLCTVW